MKPETPSKPGWCDAAGGGLYVVSKTCQIDKPAKTLTVVRRFRGICRITPVFDCAGGDRFEKIAWNVFLLLMIKYLLIR